jgi:60 kDa SS-A/Ro ribonucleoprotein
LAKVIKLSQQAEPEFIAKTAIYARERGFMKDMPALLRRRAGGAGCEVAGSGLSARD